jgi:acyl-CoA reductase-like NAD-dependent aldehyde dehydrogenase
MIGQKELFDCTNPATGQLIEQIPVSTAEDVAEAYSAMRKSAPVWANTAVKERVRILRKFQELVIDSVDIITEVINQDTGKSRQDALIEVMMTADRLHQYYKRADKWLARKRIPPGLYFLRRFYTEPRPFGVVAVLGPWNLPFDLTISPVCSALLAGNTVVVKPSEVTGATGQLLERLFQSVPELSPFIRVVHGDGGVGQMVVEGGPDLIFLTGSTQTGKIIAQKAAESMTPFICELGGKDPMIVLEDADIEAAARWGTWGAFYNSGQTCMSVERVYVIDSIYDQFVEACLKETKKLKTGFSADIDAPFDVGPLTCGRQQTTVDDHLQDALAKGANILYSGKREGLMVEPIILSNVNHDMKLMNEETFGPIMPIMPVKDEDEAIRLANDSDYGLSACVWSRDHIRAEHVAHQLEVGSVNINDTISHYPVSLLPFGGVKKSGSARTHGDHEVLQFTQMRSYAVGTAPLPYDVATQMRKPGNYRLGSAILHVMFGVTPRQKMKPLVEGLEMVTEKTRVPAKTAVAAAGVFATLVAILLSLRNRD